MIRASLLFAIALLSVMVPNAFGGRDTNAQEASSRFDEIDRFVERERDASNIPGIAIAVLEDGVVVHTAGFGSDGRGNAITPDTPFPIGSLTKSFTALAVEQLVEAGLVDLDAPVRRYLPGFTLADPAAAEQITVRMLLNQTSGLSRSDGIKPVASGTGKTLDEMVRGLADVRPNREPGASYEYSNLNFVVLGKLLEEVSGQRWQDYVEQRIFAPAGMANSNTTFDKARDAGMTGTHQYWFGFPREIELNYLEGLAPTGYLAASVADMGRYLAVYAAGGEGEAGRVLSPQGIERMHTPNTNVTSRQLMSHTFEFQYAEGWFVGEFGAFEQARWHLGDLPAFTAWMAMDPASGDGAVVLMNAGSQMEFFGGSATMSRIPIGVVNIMRGEEPPSGASIVRWYLVFDAIVLAILGLQVWSLGRLALRLRAKAEDLAGWRRKVLGYGPLSWELLGGAGVLLGYPAMLAVTWREAFTMVPDLTLVVFAIGALWLATAGVRLALLARAATETRRRRVGDTPPRVGGARETVAPG